MKMGKDVYKRQAFMRTVGNMSPGETFYSVETYFGELSFTNGIVLSNITERAIQGKSTTVWAKDGKVEYLSLIHIFIKLFIKTFVQGGITVCHCYGRYLHSRHLIWLHRNTYKNKMCIRDR